MIKIYEYILKDMNLRNKLIFDCAIGIGKSTYYWAKEIERQGGKSRIVGVDISFDGSKELIYNNLGSFMKYVSLKEADISNLSFQGDNTVDIINCDNTLVFLAMPFSKLLKSFKEFYRILKPGGLLVITSELPITDISNPDNIG